MIDDGAWDRFMRGSGRILYPCWVPVWRQVTASPENFVMWARVLTSARRGGLFCLPDIDAAARPAWLMYVEWWQQLLLFVPQNRQLAHGQSQGRLVGSSLSSGRHCCAVASLPCSILCLAIVAAFLAASNSLRLACSPCHAIQRRQCIQAGSFYHKSLL